MAPTDAELARLAGPLRVLTLARMHDAGLSRKEIRTRLSHGRLQRIWNGIYVVGPAPPEPLSMAHAAGLFCSGHASHRWGNFVNGFAPAPEPPVDVVVSRRSHLGVPEEIVVHRSTTLAPHDLGIARGVAVTSPARSILDTGDYATVSQLERLIADALLAKKCTREQLAEVLGRAGPRKAATRLRLALEDSPGITRSDAERMLRRLLRQARIEQPVTDHPIGPYFADFAWLRPMLLAEFDSYAFHSGKPAFHHDRERAAYLTALGWSILPVTYEHLTEQPLATAARIAAAIAVRS